MGEKKDALRLRDGLVCNPQGFVVRARNNIELGIALNECSFKSVLVITRYDLKFTVRL